MRSRLGLTVALAALIVPAAATAAGGSFVVVSDSQPAIALPSAATPNAPGQIAVDADFLTPPTWVVQSSSEELQGFWQSAGSAYGVPWQVLAAINKVESNFGQNMGPSSAGAVGWMQFMPDTWLRWGVDANRDGVADPWNAEDAIYAAARYLAASGGATDIARALYSYNHADWYVTEVLALADAYAGGAIDTSGFGAAGVPSIDLSSLQQRVDAAREALARAETAQQRLAPVVRGATTKLARTRLLSDALLAQKWLTIAGVRYDGAESVVNRLRKRLADAQSELDRARSTGFATPFQLAAAGSLASTWPADGYVAGDSGKGPAVAAVGFAVAQLGTPYRWGGEGPDGFDCSGLVQAAYRAAGITLPRVAQQQYNAGPSLAPGEPLQPGDLVFFGSDVEHVEHVGIVAGPGLMVDAPHSGAVVRFDSYQRSSYLGAARPALSWIEPGTSTGDIVEFTTAEPAESLTAGEILFTKNP
jgi:cell wall-associated NlpC family hydrolase